MLYYFVNISFRHGAFGRKISKSPNHLNSSKQFLVAFLYQERVRSAFIPRNGMLGHLVYTFPDLLGNVTVARWIITIFVFKSQGRVTHIRNNILENIIKISYCHGSLYLFCFYNHWIIESRIL